MNEKTSVFINKAIKKHGDKYCYDNVDYVNCSEKIIIICKIHGEFTQRPSDHLSGSGCTKCRNDKLKKLKNGGMEFFLKKSIKAHGNKYDYSQTEYINSGHSVKIICKIHGEFTQNAKTHYEGGGCPKCAIINKANGLKTPIDEVLQRFKNVHGNKYDYSHVVYLNSKTNIKILCKTHGFFFQPPELHTIGRGCPKCGQEKTTSIHRKDTEWFIDKAKKIHGDKYDYSLVDYIGIRDKVKIICKTHGVFEQDPNSHLSGKGCKSCVYKVSKAERELISFVKLICDDVMCGDRVILGGKELDVYIPSHNIAIEYNGLYWHSEEFRDNKHHYEKTEMCENKGIHLIHIYEDDWINKRDIVESRIMNLLNNNKRKIYSRKCKIKIVSFKDSKLFLEENHIQGNCPSSYRIGLYLGDELVSLMTFGGNRKVLGSSSVDDEYELLRFCNKLNTTVVGSASKLFKHFIKEKTPKKVLSYADRNWSNTNKGTMYDVLGFKLVDMTKPNYHYIVEGKRVHRFNYRKDVLVREGYDPKKSEREIMKEREIYRIYDSGNLKYVWNDNEQ